VEDELRQLFQQELSGVLEPPLGTLVRDSMQQGQRIRAVRRIYGVAALVAGVAVAVVVVPLATPTSGAARVGDSLSTSSSPAGSGPGGEATRRSGRTGATPEALLEVLLQDLPEGRTSHYAKAADGLHVQAFLHDRRSDPGMVRIKVLDGPDLLPAQMVTDVRSWKLAGGNVATTSTLPEDCTRTLHVEVGRPDGVVVAVDVGSCLAWGGFRLGRGRLALTRDQAVKIADDPRLSGWMSTKLIERGAERAPDLPTFDEGG